MFYGLEIPEEYRNDFTIKKYATEFEIYETCGGLSPESLCSGSEDFIDYVGCHTSNNVDIIAELAEILGVNESEITIFRFEGWEKKPIYGQGF